jgi:hypothetical protein
MTSQSPRIYLYKITFEEVPYYYYGVHKEKKFGERYWGRPVTHKWCWDFYTPKKQILQFFDFTDEGWLEALEVEKRLIKSFYNTDRWCLNENCGGIISLEILRKNGEVVGKQFGEKYGKINGIKSLECKVGIHGLSKEELSEAGKKGGSKARKLGVGIHGMTFEERSARSKRTGLKHKENKTGFFAMTLEQKKEAHKKSDETNRKNGTGIYRRPIETMKERGRITCKKLNTEKWMCTETGFVSTSGPLTLYQRKRGIDTSKRKRVEE